MIATDVMLSLMRVVNIDSVARIMQFDLNETTLLKYNNYTCPAVYVICIDRKCLYVGRTPQEGIFEHFDYLRQIFSGEVRTPVERPKDFADVAGDSNIHADRELDRISSVDEEREHQRFSETTIVSILIDDDAIRQLLEQALIKCLSPALNEDSCSSLSHQTLLNATEIPIATEADIVALLSHDGLLIRHIAKPNAEIKLTAVRQNGLAIQYIGQPGKDVQIEAVRQNSAAIRKIPVPVEEAQLISVTNDAFEFILLARRGIVPTSRLQSVAHHGVIKYILNSFRDKSLFDINMLVHSLRAVHIVWPELDIIERSVKFDLNTMWDRCENARPLIDTNDAGIETISEEAELNDELIE